jgi:zinc/manganese transport system substrate-binding protein
MLRLLAVCACVMLTCGCGGPAPQANTSRPVVAASFTVLADWVRNVSGDAVEVVSLVDAGLDPHTFEPTPEQALVLSKSAAVFEIGLHFETWLDRLAESSGSRAKRIVVTRDMPVRYVDAPANKEPDPHIWHDPVLAAHAVRVIASELIVLFPEHAAAFASNRDKYLAELHALDKWVQSESGALPQSSRKLFTSHDTFGYFGQRYAFQLMDSAFGAITTEIGDPSAKHVAELIRQIRDAKVKSIFCENIQNPKLMERIASEANVALAPPLFTDALGEPGTAGGTYLGMVRYNVATIVKGLRE